MLPINEQESWTTKGRQIKNLIKVAQLWLRGRRASFGVVTCIETVLAIENRRSMASEV